MAIIHVFTINHRHGNDVFLYPTEEAAFAAVVAYVDEWWSREVGEVPPTDPAEKVRAYFDQVDDEWYTIGEYDAPWLTAVGPVWYTGSN